MSILGISFSGPTFLQSLSSAKVLSASTVPIQSLSLTTSFSHPSVAFPSPIPSRTTPIRMGCPRICPGGVTKMKWRRMQARKAKQLHEAGLARERLLYEMRKRAELKAAVAELERPWENAEKPRNLSLGGTYDQADRKVPELLSPDNGEIETITTMSEEFQSSGWEDQTGPPQIGKSDDKMGLQRKGRYKNSRSNQSASDRGGNASDFKSRDLDLQKKVKVGNSRERLGRREVGKHT